MLRPTKKPLSEIEKLELDNQRMEARLKAFRDKIEQQKQTRQSSHIWRTATHERGSLNSYASQVLAKKNKRFQGIAKQGISFDTVEQELAQSDAVIPPTFKQVSNIQQNKSILELNQEGKLNPTPPPRPPPAEQAPRTVIRLI